MKNLVFFASGSGTNFQSVIDAIEAGKIDAQIRGLITNEADIKSIERAEKHKIPAKVLQPSEFNSPQEYEETLLSTLKEWKPYLIILAGYLLKIPGRMIEKYEGRIINIHPSLLPAYGGKGFYGMNVHEAVLEGGETETGCSVHLVTKEYDEGPVLAQRKVTVRKTDNTEKLAKRVLRQEHKLLTEVVKNLANNLHFYSHK